MIGKPGKCCQFVAQPSRLPCPHSWGHVSPVSQPYQEAVSIGPLAPRARMVPMKHPRLVFFSAALLALPLAAQVKLTPAPGKVSVEIDGKPFTDFYMSGEAFNAKVTKPYLWPLRAASGTYITRAWPMEDVPEEAAEKKPSRNGPAAMDHQHQRGLWFAHDNVNKLDFWNNEWSYFADQHLKNLGRINLKKAGEVKSGKTQGGIAATFEWTDMEGNNPILTESRVMTFYSDPKLRYFDVDITLTAI